MNWSDLLVLAIIAGFGLIGMYKGFILSIFKLASFFVSAIISIKAYPLVAKVLMQTALYTNIKTYILENLLQQHAAQGTKVNGQIKEAAANAVIDKLQLPGFLKGTLLEQMPNPGKLVNINKLMDMISIEITKIVIDILSLLLLYVAIRIALIFARVILQGVAKLPLFKQIDKLGGFGIGAVEGLLTVYIIFAVIMLFNASPSFKEVYTAIDSSMIAKFFYQNNFIVDWMFPNTKQLEASLPILMNNVKALV